MKLPCPASLHIFWLVWPDETGLEFWRVPDAFSNLAESPVPGRYEMMGAGAYSNSLADAGLCRKSRTLAVYALTPQGREVGGRIADSLDGVLFLGVSCAPADYPAEQVVTSLAGSVARNFREFAGHVFVTSCGIAVRVCAPWLMGKDRDPAVVAVDQAGRFAVSLISGHLGGANVLAGRVAGVLAGQAVLTTATDVRGLAAIDVLAAERGLVIGNLEAVRTVGAAMLQGGSVAVWDPEDWLGFDGAAPPEGYRPVADAARWTAPGVWVSWRTDAPPGALRLHPRCLYAGLGCRQGAGGLAEFLRTAMTEAGLAWESLAGLASVEAKRTEPGLREAADKLRLPLVFFTHDQVNMVDVPHPSEAARRFLGVESVSEASALLATEMGELVLPKVKSAVATLAVARRRM